MKTLKELKKDGFVGSVDCNVETSLFEYGLIHKEEKDKTLFVYGVQHGLEDEYTSFDSASYTESDFSSLINESWFNLKSVLSFVGMEEAQWLATPLYSKIFDCITYYGSENIFGSSYYPFEILK